MINSQRQDSCYRVDLQRDQKMNIQELLAGNGPITETAAAAALTAVSSSSSTTPLVSSSSTRSENLRCPRCDSSNTKFCYYNNYNLTQPRHFCKTCRRYWTKGGALRNVPIGGGCRKNKNSVVSSVSLGKSTATKWKSTFLGGLEPENNKTFLFTPSNTHQNNNHHNHHAFLSMLRPGHQNPNPSAAINPGGEVSGLWRNSQHRGQLQNGFVLGDAQNTGGVQELLYQRLIKSTTANNYNNLNCYEQYPLALHGNSNAAASPAILESAPVSAAGEFGYWNPSLSTWSDLPTTGGAYP